MTNVFLRRVTCVLSFVLCLIGSVASAQEISPPEAAELYDQGMIMLQTEDYSGAARVFQELTGRFGDSPAADLFLFHRAKAEYYAGRLAESIASFSYFIQTYNSTAELPYAWYFLGNAQFRAGRSGRALKSYLNAFGLSTDDRLDRLATDAITTMLDDASSVSIDRDLFAGVPASKRCRAVAIVAVELVSRGLNDEAARISAGCANGAPIGNTESGSGELTVAVAVPLSGELRSFGEELINGITVGAEKLRNEDGAPILIKTYDTKGEPVDAGRIIGELAGGGTPVVIGPLTSDEAAVASAALRTTDLPMIAPAATQAGLTRLSSTSFQLSPNVELQGVRMAEYAINELGADSAFVFTPTTTDNLRMARAFIEHFESAGGKVIATEYYSARDTDFGPFIRDAKSIILGTHPDSTYYIDNRGDTIETDGLPVHVDVIFAPGESSQIRLLLPQIHFYNVKGHLLGSDGWGDRNVYRLEANITRGAVFPSSHLQEEHSQEYLTFAAAFDSRFARQPQRMASLGYDAVMLIGRGYPNAWRDRESLVNYLRQVRNYAGASGDISFGEYRENVEMPLYRIENGDAVPLEETLAPGDSEETAPADDSTGGE